MTSPGLTFFSTCFPSIFSIVDPLAVIPVFLALVSGETPLERRRIAFRATITLTTVLMVFAITGSMIFHFFGITVAAFKIAGGVILFRNGLDMIQAKHGAERATPEEQSEAAVKADVAIIPLGIPLLSGPGAIATVTVWSARAKGAAEDFALYASILSVALLTLLVLNFAARLARFFGTTGINIASRVMGLILAATAVQFVIDGVREALHAPL